MRSPKLASNRAKDWYRYYAGYAPEFVEDALTELDLSSDACVLDPWNGSGTTTAVAQSRGVSAVGYDANPALVLIARSRLLGADVVESIEPLRHDLLDHALLFDLDDGDASDPLRSWFDTNAVREIRGLEHAIRHVLVEHGSPAEPRGAEHLGTTSALAAFFYVALFDAVRSKLRSFVTSNPTWIKTANPDAVLTLDYGAIHDAFQAASERLTNRLRLHDLSDVAQQARIEMASSSALPLEDDAVSAIVTSPPYCTRIDYVAATRPELAVLGLTHEEITVLRSGMMGTPTIATDTPSQDDAWGFTVTDLLERIISHRSRASATYYRKYYLQYFDSLMRSLRELRRVLRAEGQAVIVVQDSYYKDVHIDLPRIVHEMSESIGFTLDRREDFAIPRTKAAVHPSSRSWRSTFTATESILLFN